MKLTLLRKSALAAAVISAIVSAVSVIARVDLVAQRGPAAAPLAGMATLGGAVSADRPFKAAQVYIFNPERRMLYMVYTNAGRYRATTIRPGTYEISVTASGGLSSEVQKITLKAGDSASANLKLENTSSDPNAKNAPFGGSASRLRPSSASLGFDAVYPPDPAVPILERTCISCHGPNFLPNQQWSERQWRGAMDRMFGPAEDADKRKSPTVAADGKITRGVLTAAEREILVPYLVKNFGPNSQRRQVKFEHEMQVDEAKVANAMYIEYYVPPDPPGELSNKPEYKGINQGRNRYTQDPSFDPEGNVWLSERGFPNRLVKLNPLTGEYKDFYPPDPLNGMHDVRVANDGMIWVPEHHGLNDRGKSVKYLNRYNPRTNKWDGRWPLDPDNVIKTNDGEKWPQSMAIDSKGNVYVGWINGGALSMWEKATEKVTVYIPPTRTLNMYGVVPDKDDNIWVSLWTAGVIAKFDSHSRTWTEYRPPTPNAVIRRPQLDADNNVWFGIYAAGKRPGKLVKLETRTGHMTEWTMPWDAAEPYDVNPDPAGNIWITDSGQGGTLVKFNPKDQSFTPYPSPQGADKPSIEVTRDGAIWYSPRGVDRTTVKYPGLGVLYPDMDHIRTLAAYAGERWGG